MIGKTPFGKRPVATLAEKHVLRGGVIFLSTGFGYVTGVTPRS